MHYIIGMNTKREDRMKYQKRIKGEDWWRDVDESEVRGALGSSTGQWTWLVHKEKMFRGLIINLYSLCDFRAVMK